MVSIIPNVFWILSGEGSVVAIAVLPRGGSPPFEEVGFGSARDLLGALSDIDRLYRLSQISSSHCERYFYFVK